MSVTALCGGRRINVENVRPAKSTRKIGHVERQQPRPPPQEHDLRLNLNGNGYDGVGIDVGDFWGITERRLHLWRNFRL